MLQSTMTETEFASRAKQPINSQLLLPVAGLKTRWKKKGKKELHSFVKTPEGTEQKARLRGSAR
jgi:hypothetical protein